MKFSGVSWRNRILVLGLALGGVMGVVAEGIAQSIASGPENYVQATPTPLPTATPTIAPTATFTPTSTPTPIPTATATPDPGRCDFTRLNVQDRMGDRELDFQIRNNPSELLDRRNLPAGFQCVSDMMDEAVRCADQRTRNNRNNAYWDDGMLTCMSGRLFGVLAHDSGTSFHQAYLVPIDERNRVLSSHQGFCLKKASIHPDFGAGTRITDFYCTAGHVLFDRNCNRIPLDANGTPVDPSLRGCGDATVHFYRSSPISLVWESGADNEVAVNLVNFPLDPSSPGSLVTWKASSRLPLVVYDPEHADKITSATQLFGNWTFGGHRVASLNQNHLPSTPPWKDGYEALATLDVNGDSEISGDELRPLALWFDKNSNGISEPGEVVPMEETGVTALYYTSDSYNSATKTIRASRGFMRKVDGKEVVGPSIDWFGGSAASTQVLVQGLIKDAATELPTDGVTADAEPRQNGTAKTTTKSDSIWNGTWEWRAEANSSSIPDGYLTLGNHDGVIRGFAINPTLFRHENGTEGSFVGLFGFTGSLEKSDSKEESVSFSIKHGLTVLRTTVRRGSSEDEIKGETTVVDLNASANGELLSYKWVGVRKR